MTAIIIENAQINTVNIEIKTLTIRDKQVTLSVFRQIPTEDIFELLRLDKCVPKGLAWGNVNYFWGDDKEKNDVNYFHILWQKDQQLKRCIIPKDYRRTHIYELMHLNKHRLIEEGNDRELLEDICNKGFNELKQFVNSLHDLPQLYIAI